jgi:tRNA-dihydrouridine synthase
LETGVAEPPPSLADQLAYIRALYDDLLRHYGLRIGLRHARKHLGWALGIAAASGNVSTSVLKTWRGKILTVDDPAGVQRSLVDAFEDFAWSAAA